MESETLFVVLGAGASCDAATDGFVRPTGFDWRPPLVKELFGPRFSRVLERNPYALAVAADLNGVDPDSLVIEEHLRTQYRESEHGHERLKYLAMPLYLQELLWTCTREFARSPDNLDRLIRPLLALPDVVFVSLNYDTLLDDRLGLYDPLDNLDNYVSPGRPWSLVKLHGSVNWARPVIHGEYRPNRIPHDLEMGPEIVMRYGDLAAMRSNSTRNLGEGAPPWQFYPAVSVPVGTADELVCPASHVDFLRSKFGEQCDGIDLLVIGYSGNDREVINLITSTGRPLRSLAIVNQNQEAAIGVEHTLRRQGLSGRPGAYRFTRRFSDFAREPALSDYLNWLAQQRIRRAGG